MNAYELGSKAYKNGIRVPAFDAEFMAQVEGSKSIEQMKEWISGNEAELQKDLKARFPELYQ